jgi:nitroreductase
MSGRVKTQYNLGIPKVYPNDTIRLLNERASCRNFLKKKISPRILNRILESGVHAASGGNLQPYSIIKIENAGVKHAFAEKCSQDFIEKAPVLLMFCIDWRRLQRWADLENAPFTATSSFRHFWISFQDTIICAQNICTAADALGLGSVYIGTVLEMFHDIRAMLELPDGVFPVVLLCLGYPKSESPKRLKFGIDVLVHHEKYHEIPDDLLRTAFSEKYSHRSFEITPERLQMLHEVCRDSRSPEFADRCIKAIEKQGFINVAQFIFGLHYSAHKMPLGNEDFLKIMQQFGFNWFSSFKTG